jgi:glycosyltransferase involved in cell wall biosynthesis
MGQYMKASVVIPTFNRAQILPYTLRYYGSQVCPKEAFECIIIDDGSTDGTPALFKNLGFMDSSAVSKGGLGEYTDSIEKLRAGLYKQIVLDIRTIDINPVYVKYIRIKKSGRSVARNIGIRFSQFPLIIFADDDIFVEPGFVKKHVESHTADDKTVIMGRVIHTVDFENPFNARWKLKDINMAFLATGNASVLKCHIVDAGLFDEKYTVYGWEDFDLGIHLKDIGLGSLKKKIYGYHYDPPETFLKPQKIYKKERERGITAVYFYKTHRLKWVKRFTLIDNKVLKCIFGILGCRNWFLKKKKIGFLKGLFRLIIRYKGYFDGVQEGKDDLQIQ